MTEIDTPTGTPWQIVERFRTDDPIEIIGNIDGDANDDGTLRMTCTHVAELADNEDSNANAAFICKAVNNHKALVEALTDLTQLVNNLQWGQKWPGRHHGIMDRVEAALKAVKQ